MSDMKILTLDIETAPNLVYTWGLWNQNVPIKFIVKPTYMLSWAAKWVGKKHVEYRDVRDKDFLTAVWNLIDEADAIITYNGVSFDMKHLNREFVEAGIAPPFPAQQIDLLSTVRRRFKYPSNKLDYVAGVLLDEHKVETTIDLWFGCMNGVKKSWNLMKRYNKQDVVLTEKVYQRIKPWILGHPNHGLYVKNQEDPVCRSCGSDDVIAKGWQPTSVSGYQRYRCNNCGVPLRGRYAIKGGKKATQVLS